MGFVSSAIFYSQHGRQTWVNKMGFVSVVVGFNRQRALEIRVNKMGFVAFAIVSKVNILDKRGSTKWGLFQLPSVSNVNAH